MLIKWIYGQGGVLAYIRRADLYHLGRENSKGR